MTLPVDMKSLEVLVATPPEANWIVLDKTGGVRVNTLYENKETGIFTALFRWAPGSEFPLHEHVDIEQTYVLAGALEDEEGNCTAGNFVWRPSGSRHVARSPQGALLIAMLLKPNKFLA